MKLGLHNYHCFSNHCFVEKVASQRLKRQYKGKKVDTTNNVMDQSQSEHDESDNGEHCMDVNLTQDNTITLRSISSYILLLRTSLTKSINNLEKSIAEMVGRLIKHHLDDFQMELNTFFAVPEGRLSVLEKRVSDSDNAGPS